MRDIQSYGRQTALLRQFNEPSNASRLLVTVKYRSFIYSDNKICYYKLINTGPSLVSNYNNETDVNLNQCKFLKAKDVR